MSGRLDETHDPAATSWVESAQASESDFPLQNLPLGVYRPRGEREAAPRLGVAIGKQTLDLAAVAAAGLLGPELEPPVAAACAAPRLNALMSLERTARAALRRRLFALLAATASAATRRAAAAHLRPLTEVEMLLPAVVADYSDFYASIHHARRVGQLFRPDHPLLPNYKHVPIGYHGRASSLVISGTEVRRPRGQTAPSEGSSLPGFGPTRRLDYEVELGFFVGGGNGAGEPIPIAAAGKHLFGVCLVNDWSARDIQAWEYQPLGPFLAKSFATTVSPWVVTMEALAPFRAPLARPAGDPAPLAYLDDADDRAAGALDIAIEAWLETAAMRQSGVAAWRLSQANARDLYWTPAQMLAHQTSNGCAVHPGDLLASGTISGEARDAGGCLLELTTGGRSPVSLPDGETRQFLADGDEVILRARCQRAGYRAIGFGECRGRIAPAAK